MSRPIPRPPASRSAQPVEVLTVTTAGGAREDVLAAARAKAVAWFGHERVALRNARVKTGNPSAWSATTWWVEVRP